MFKRMCVNVVWCVAFLLVSGLWSNGDVSAQGVDSYTKLMLHADGADQGTSFTDSASGAKTVTNAESYDSYTKLMLHIDNNVTDSAAGKTVTNNNVAFSSSAYKMGGYSGVFNGSNAYLSLADSDDWNFGSGDFTIDFWVRLNTTSGTHVICSQKTDSSNRFFLALEGNIILFDTIVSGAYDIQFERTGASFSTGVWYHIAIVRSGSTFYCFKDGVQLSSTYTSSNSIANYSDSFYVGQANVVGSEQYFNGYLDELRISKGIARWTSDFTPPSSPYGKVATVTSQKKFGAASGEFHGSGDYLSLADSDDWNFGSGDFTIDGWVKANSLTGDPTLFAQYLSSSYYMESKIGSDGSVYFRAFNSGGSVNFTSAAGEIVVGNWYHFALVRNGSSWKIFKNGSVIASASVSLTFDDYTTVFGVGVSNLGLSTPSQFLNGYLDELRISKGIARWTSNFTPPSAPYDTDTTPPTVSSTSPASSATGVGIGSAISATFSEDMDSSTITTSAFTLSSSSGSSVSGTVSYSNKTATFTPSSNLSYSTTYTATITTGVKDTTGNVMSSNYTWSFTTGSAPDTTAPSNVSVSINSGASYTNTTAVTLNLSATDGVGVTGYYVSDSSATPSPSASAWTSVTTTTHLTANVSYTVSSGDGNKTVYVWYKDVAGNVSTTANGSITLDTTAPTVTITSPTSTGVYTSTVGSLNMSGNASDSASGIGAVTWNNTTTGSNGTATGTTSWTISAINLSMGENTINVVARDGANNTGTGTIKVTYSGNAPTVTTNAATNVTATSATLNGTVNANGLSTSAWFQYGLSAGTYTGTTTTQSVSGSGNTTVNIAVSGLSSGKTYYYRIAASSSAGTSYGSELSFSTPDSNAPTGSCAINSGAAYTGTTTATLNLSATDDVMVSGYYVSQNSTPPSSSAGGWVAVAATTTYTGNISYTLSGGDGNKTVYVWYKDFAGNVSGASSGSITLDTTAPTVTITSPTSDATYSTASSSISLGGGASDATSGVKTVAWSSNKGGSGTASGTTSWTVSTISLSVGDNVITVTATDNAGNAVTDVLTVRYAIPMPTPSPTPAVTPSPIPQPSPTPQPLPSPTATATTIPTPLPSPTPVATFTPQPTPAASPTPPAVPSPTSQPSPTATSTPVILPSPTPVTTSTPVASPTPQAASSPTPQVVPSPTPAVSPTLQPAPSPTPQAQPPTAVTGSATNVTATSATLTGTVNANGLSTTAWFEYGTVKGFYGNKTTSQTVTGSSDTTVSITITGLTAGTTYYYRIVAQNNAGTTNGSEMPFQYSIKPNAPTVETEGATEVTNTTARLNGKCNPNSLSTTVWFEYGVQSGKYDYQTTTQTISGSSYLDVSATVTGLTVGTTYYYRIAAMNSAGTSYGKETKFYKVPETVATPTPVTTLTPAPTPKASPTARPSPQPTASPVLTPRPKPTPTPGKGYVFGTVSDEEGNHLSGVTVSLVGANGSSPTQSSVERRGLFALQVGANGSSSTQNTTTTDADGYYEFGGLEAGNYTLAYKKSGYVTQTQDVTLEAGQALDMGETTLEAITYGKIYGTVVDIKGNPIESVSLKLKGLRTKVTKTEATDADGFFEFSGLSADTYVITAKKKRYKTVKKPVKIEDGESKEVEIEMRKTTKRVKEM